MSDTDDLISSFSATLKVSKTMATPSNNGLNMLKMPVDTIPNYNVDINLLNNFLNAIYFCTTSDAWIKNYLIRVFQTKFVGRAQILVGSRPELNSWPLIKEALEQCFGDNRNI